MCSCGVRPRRKPAKWVCSGVETISRPPRVRMRMPSVRLDEKASVTRAGRMSPLP